MFKIAIVIFREFLEISLLLGIILAATKNIKNRAMHIVLGIMIGTIGSASIAFFMKSITQSFHHIGDEILNAGIILLTAFIIGFTSIWMNKASKEIKNKVNNIVIDIESEKINKVMLTLLVSTTIFREGVEIVLFIFSLSHSAMSHGENYLLGFALGALSGIGFGVGIYLGILKFAGKYIFKVCFMLLSFIAAGLASEAAGILTSIGIINIYYKPLWNTSSFISDSGFLGKTLKILIGYDSSPNGMQLIFYFTTISLLFTISKIQNRKTF